MSLLQSNLRTLQSTEWADTAASPALLVFFLVCFVGVFCVFLCVLVFVFLLFFLTNLIVSVDCVFKLKIFPSSFPARLIRIWKSWFGMFQRFLDASTAFSAIVHVYFHESNYNETAIGVHRSFLLLFVCSCEYGLRIAGGTDGPSVDTVYGNQRSRAPIGRYERADGRTDIKIGAKAARDFFFTGEIG